MFRPENFKKTLFLTYLIVGILNVVVIFSFSIYIFQKAKLTLLERAEAQMISARSMASAKLVMYFEKLKLRLDNLSEELADNKRVDFDPTLSGLWVGDQGKKQLLGTALELPDLKLFTPNKFYPFKNQYLLKILLKGQTYLWLVNDKGVSELFSDREGLGSSGEVYLVGTDSKIKSASRHVKDWSNTEVRNQSTEKAFEKLMGVNVVQDYRDVEVVSAYSYFEFDDLKFALLSEIDLDEVLTPLKYLLLTIYALSILLLVINLLYSIKLTRTIYKTVVKQKKEIENLNTIKEKSDKENALKIFRVQENERERISFSLHDSVGQYLTVLKWGLTKIKSEEKDENRSRELERLSETCDDVISEIREISHDLMPTLIRDFGVCSAIRDYIEKQNLVGPLKIIYSCAPELVDQKFKKDFEVNLYRMVQEFFQNNLKHSKATVMEIALASDGNHFSLHYQDDGIGLSKDAPLPHSISYRAKLFGGTLKHVRNQKGLEFEVTFDFSEIRE